MYAGVIFLIIFLSLFSVENIFSQTEENPDCTAVHHIGRLVLSSGGGTSFGGIYNNDATDCLLNKKVFKYGIEYPKNSGISALSWGYIFIGGIIDSDTLVNTNTYSPIYWEKYRSTLEPNNPDYEGAVSEQDYVSVSVDNSVNSRYISTDYKPLNIQVTKKSYAWSYEYAEDFVLFDIEIKNIGKKPINETYIGLHLSFATGYFNGNNAPENDNLSGLYIGNKTENKCTDFRDNLKFLWGADNDGNPVDGEYTDILGIVDG